jgi:ribonuclease P protein component
MLPKEFKIKDKELLDTIFAKGKRLRISREGYFSLRYLTQPAEDKKEHDRFALAIPKALKLKSTQRNSARRRIFAAITGNYTFTREQNYDIVVTLHRDISSLSFKEIVSELIILLKKLHGKN